jgi:hypothetical protein
LIRSGWLREHGAIRRPSGWVAPVKTFVASASLLLASTAWGHHSYAMFDGSKTVTVSGIVAKVDWSNPHVFIWMHVPNSRAASGYDLYAFSTGSTHILARNGWSQTTLRVGEKISVEYWPLKDGRTGGQLTRAIHEDGHVTRGIGAPSKAVSSTPETARDR